MAPTVTTKVLTMVMDLKWTCAAALADTNVTDMAAAKSIIDGATGFLLTSKYTAGKNQVASGTAGTARTDAAASTDALAATQLALVKTGMKTTFAAVYTSLAAKLMSATVTDMSAGSLGLAAAAAGITALAMAF